MNIHLENRLKGIQAVLMGHHSGGRGLPNEVIGNEREYLVSRFLSKVLPPVFRFGHGAITDLSGALTGQLDTVMELPFGPNYPMPSGSESLYLAETVCAVIEIKSNLCKQWGEVEETVRRVKLLKRYPEQTSHLLLGVPPAGEVGFGLGERIPCYAVGYTRYETVHGLEERLRKTHPDSRPDGALSIEYGSFVGMTKKAAGVSGLNGFIADLMSHANNALCIAYPRVRDYGTFEAR